MIRRLTGIAAALVLTGGIGLTAAGLGLASTAANGSVPAASAAAPAAPAAPALSVLPNSGSYTGVDHAGRTITFTFGGNQMSHFMTNHQVVGGAHVSNGMWHETCHNGICAKGHWENDTTVVGLWRYSNSNHWRQWEACAYAR